MHELSCACSHRQSCQRQCKIFYNESYILRNCYHPYAKLTLIGVVCAMKIVDPNPTKLQFMNTIQGGWGILVLGAEYDTGSQIVSRHVVVLHNSVIMSYISFIHFPLQGSFPGAAALPTCDASFSYIYRVMGHAGPQQII